VESASFPLLCVSLLNHAEQQSIHVDGLPGAVLCAKCGHSAQWAQRFPSSKPLKSRFRRVYCALCALWPHFAQSTLSRHTAALAAMQPSRHTFKHSTQVSQPAAHTAERATRPPR